MRNPRVYHPRLPGPGQTVELPADTALRLGRVLRLRAGAALTLFDGAGGEYDAELAEFDKRGARVRLGARQERECESPLPVTLAQCISRGERMDYTVRKAVELGVSAIAPLHSEFCQVRLEGERAERRLAHWQAVVIAACEQCGRNRLPALEPPAALADWLTRGHAGTRIVLDPRGGRTLRSLDPIGPSLTLLAGPEGGLSEPELAAAERNGFVATRIGPRILRTETAPLAALAAIQCLWGDLG